MRPVVEEHLKGRTLPLIMAHKGGTAYGRENALETIQKGLAFNPDIVELDVRKSRDGVLYCHHGSIPFGVAIASFFGFLTFRQIQMLVGHRDTLRDILAIIPDRFLVYLDLKDSSITADDLRSLIAGRKGVWVGPFGSVAWLKRLRAGLGEEYAYSLNRPPILFPKRLAKAVEGVADLIGVFRWNWSESTVKEIEDLGIFCYRVDWFTSRKEYIDQMPFSRYRGLFFSLYDLRDAAELKRET